MPNISLVELALSSYLFTLAHMHSALSGYILLVYTYKVYMLEVEYFNICATGRHNMSLHVGIRKTVSVLFLTHTVRQFCCL